MAIARKVAPALKPDVATLSPEAELAYLRDKVKQMEREIIILRENIRLGR